MLVITFVLVLLLALLLFTIAGLIALLSADARPTEPIFIVLRLHSDSNACPGFCERILRLRVATMDICVINVSRDGSFC